MMIRKYTIIYCLWVGLLSGKAVTGFAQELRLSKIHTGINSSIRGLSVVDNSIAWLSGGNGIVGITNNGGQTWNFLPIKGFETMDFRSIYAFDDKKAIIANAGSPANILITQDGGQSWQIVYTNEHEAAFLDGVDFWDDQHGTIYGDPINGKMLILRTSDGGLTWHEIGNAPVLHDGEASFAASGTGIRCIDKDSVFIATGGSSSRMWISADKGENWTFLTPPILQGESSQGIFSMAIRRSTWILVGGDYKNEGFSHQHILYSDDQGQTWKSPDPATRGYRESVEYITKNMVVAVGPSGMDISQDGGKTWQPLNEESGFHVVRKARDGDLIIVAGSRGQVAILDSRH